MNYVRRAEVAPTYYAQRMLFYCELREFGGDRPNQRVKRCVVLFVSSGIESICGFDDFG
jgi:hypothetical protein